MRDSLPTARYSPVCNVLRQWKTSLILTYRVYQLYDKEDFAQKYDKCGARSGSPQLVNATALGLAYPAARQMAYTYCSVCISDLKPLTGTSADQVPHTKSRSLATA